MIYGIFCMAGVVLVVGIVLFGCHQQRLAVRARLMREAVRNRDFTFRLPVRGLFFGEKALQEALNDLGRDIGRLVAQNEVESWQKLTRVLTHEIMNAIAPISSISQAYLGQPDIKGTPYEEGICAIHDTAVGLSAFVESYRKLTQLQAPIPGDVPLEAFVSTIRSLYPTLSWQVDIPSSVSFFVDESMLRQVLINLIKNAVEAGATAMDIRWAGALWVSNNGMPIPADAAREIFIPFFTTKKTGTGIGLSLSRQLMVTQGGNIALADTPVSGYHVSFIISAQER